MSDPFEARMRFTGMLQSLNATTTAAQKAAIYALKFKDYDEDFQSCILEQLGRVCHIFFMIFASLSHEVSLGRHEQPDQHYVFPRAAL
jgi:hypothetical protein